MIDLMKFVEMSKYAGERFDLTQAGGGNSSVKLDDGKMLIKASGFLLSDVERDKGFSTLDQGKVVASLQDASLDNILEKRAREKHAAELINDALISTSIRPSIETFLHSLLYKFTLHTHPIVVNMITCQKDWRQKLFLIFGDRALYVPYETPGIELALVMNNEICEYKIKNNQEPQIVFLQNHGLIISADQVEEVYRLNEEVLHKLEQDGSVDLSRYKYTNKISTLVNNINEMDDVHYIAYLSEDIHINKLLNDKSLLGIRPFCPDGYVFCGVNVLVLHSLEVDYLKSYIKKNFELPKVIFYNNMVFFIANNVRKAKEIEEVFKFHLLTINTIKEDVISLEMDEIQYLGNWEAEKYRQKL